AREGPRDRRARRDRMGERGSPGPVRWLAAPWHGGRSEAARARHRPARGERDVIHLEGPTESSPQGTQRRGVAPRRHGEHGEEENSEKKRIRRRREYGEEEKTSPRRT